MESTPAVFAGAVFALFGAGLLLWTGARSVHGVPVAEGGVRPVAAAVIAGAVGLASLAASVWCFGHI
ncbi:hypothetical protein GTW43_19185 [Streptomyces sp. SID5785]|uniref:hypothetical protein n=1 Tax=Streptomyces sp. SID5785 TaxID=2690309 RepID=UPI00136153CA|nr:hypothetical protein [Streptomyces sp. SID5785]MZD07193.1 hypothetical protein [Streptomyces sp. SID5785]